MPERYSHPPAVRSARPLHLWVCSASMPRVPTAVPLARSSSPPTHSAHRHRWRDGDRRGGSLPYRPYGGGYGQFCAAPDEAVRRSRRAAVPRHRLGGAAEPTGVARDGAAGHLVNTAGRHQAMDALQHHHCEGLSENFATRTSSHPAGCDVHCRAANGKDEPLIRQLHGRANVLASRPRERQRRLPIELRPTCHHGGLQRRGRRQIDPKGLLSVLDPRFSAAATEPQLGAAVPAPS
jgi:hypothetical protein